MQDRQRFKQGLSTAEAQKRLLHDGENTLENSKKISAGKIFASQFKDFLVLILLASTVISVAMGEFTEAFTIIAIVFLNAVLGFFQEYRTEKTLDALKNMSAPTAKVIRDSKEVTIPASQVVKGDIVLLKSGDRICADGRIVESTGLKTDESMLTGESEPVEKTVCTELTPKITLNRADIAYMGTTVTSGHGKIEIVSTGMATQMGAVAGMLNDIDDEMTPLQRKLDSLGKWIAAGCLIICAVVTLTGIMRGENIFDMFITGLSLSVAAVPEGLPAIVTIALGLAVTRMLKRRALIRKLHAVETLGCADVICSDKTGTLTENKMTVRRVYVYNRDIELSGKSDEVIGDFTENGRIIVPSRDPVLKKLMEVSVLCSNAQIVRQSVASVKDYFSNQREKLTVSGEATESALLVMAAKAQITDKNFDGTASRLWENPFDSTRKMMSVLIKYRSGETNLLVKGAAEIVLKKCSCVLTSDGVKPMTPLIKREILKKCDELAQNAMRVLCTAYKKGESKSEEELIFIGLAGMIDPPRPEAVKAVSVCRKAGIRPVMITGDYVITAAAIAKEMNILRQGELVMSGEEIDSLSDEEFALKLPKVSVFARVTPAHKLKIVRTLKKQGHIVAMTGDGVNDAPAVKEADIGVAMGKNGTDVTKQAADVVLLDDNFATLVAAVEEGRVIYGNIRKFIRYLLSCNIGEVATMFLGMLMGMPVVLLPIQILLVNLVTDSLPAIALGLEPAEKDVMSRRPRKREESVFSDGLLSTIVFRGMLIGLTTLGVFGVFMNLYKDISCARTAALAALVITQLIHVFECKSERQTIFEIPLFNNLKLLGAVIISGAVLFMSIFNTFLQGVFQTVALNASQMMIILAMCMIAPVLSAFLNGIFKRSDETREKTLVKNYATDVKN